MQQFHLKVIKRYYNNNKAHVLLFVLLPVSRPCFLLLL